MTEKKMCPGCETKRDVTLIEHQENVSIEGKNVEFLAKSYKCTTCHELFDTKETLGENLSVAREMYEQRYRTPSTKELVELRTQYGASQKAFGVILGFGELTMNKYENDENAIPSPPNRLLLKLASNPDVFKEMYRLNSYKIGALQRKRIEASEKFNSSELHYTKEESASISNVIELSAYQDNPLYVQREYAQQESLDVPQVEAT